MNELTTSSSTATLERPRPTATTEDHLERLRVGVDAALLALGREELGVGLSSWGVRPTPERPAGGVIGVALAGFSGERGPDALDEVVFVCEREGGQFVRQTWRLGCGRRPSLTECTAFAAAVSRRLRTH